MRVTKAILTDILKIKLVFRIPQLQLGNEVGWEEETFGFGVRGEAAVEISKVQINRVVV